MANDTTVSQGLGHNLNYENIDTSKTLAEADSGVVQNIIADAITITLPATVVGRVYYIRNGGVPASSDLGAPTGSNGTVLVTISPNASDKIMGNGFTAADNTDVTNTKATALVGDYIKLVGDGADGWFIAECRGIWVNS